MPSSLLHRVTVALDGPGAPGAGERVLVAVSGGPDSTALLAALCTLVRDRDLALTAGHVDHGLRGRESAEDRAAVGALALRLEVPFEMRVVAVPGGANLEARARRARHRALRAMADEVGATTIALGHTEEDQVETVLLRLLRGAGRGGLGGMRPRNGRLWRPLLDVPRADVRRFLADHALPFRVDRTNADLAHTRNRLRRLVVPLLAREFNPSLGRAIAALARRLHDEDDYLRAAAALRLPAHARGDDLAVAVAGEPGALGRRIVQSWLGGSSPRSVPAHTIERVLDLARGRGRGAVAVPGAARVLREGDVLVRRAGRKAAKEAFRCPLSPGETVAGPGGHWRLTLSVPRERVPDELAGLSSRCARFDADALAMPLVVRSPEPGDRIRDPGVGTRKLQDVLVDAKVPRERRGTVPVVVDAAGAIVWVPGHLRGEAARVTKTTTRVVDGTLG